MKKKFLSLVLAISMLLSFMPVIATATTSGTCGDNLTWVLDSSGTLTISGTGNMYDYTNANSPFYYNSDIQKIIIEDGVTSIGSSAFFGCHSLTNITIPDSVTTIGSYVFSSCSGLADITIPNSVTSIGSSAFSGCSNLTNITVETGNPNYKSKNGILFSKDEKTIYCYPRKKSGISYVIPNSVTSIGDYAFYHCRELTSITIPDGVTSIGNSAFSNCTNLTDITIPDSVTSISNSAFNMCSGLTSITITNSVTSIGDYAFLMCSGLISITIPNSITSIGNYAFSGCSGLTSTTIPNSVTSIGDGAFSNCKSLTSIEVDTNNPNYQSENGILFSKDKKAIICYPSGKVGTSYTIPNSVTSIGSSAFSGCSSLTSITIPSSVTSIGDKAFSSCSGLTSITIPNSVTSIGGGAFLICESLTSITILSKTTTFDRDVFDYCSSSLVIKGYAGSTAETYASENGHTFEALTESTPIPTPDSEPEKVQYTVIVTQPEGGMVTIYNESEAKRETADVPANVYSNSIIIENDFFTFTAPSEIVAGTDTAGVFVDNTEISANFVEFRNSSKEFTYTARADGILTVYARTGNTKKVELSDVSGVQAVQSDYLNEGASVGVVTSANVYGTIKFNVKAGTEYRLYTRAGTGRLFGIKYENTDYPQSTTSLVVNNGDEVRVVAIANENYVNKSILINGEEKETSKEYIFTVTGDTTVTAEFNVESTPSPTPSPSPTPTPTPKPTATPIPTPIPTPSPTPTETEIPSTGLKDGDSGTSGGFSWRFTGDTLYLSGSGNMFDYTAGNAPWYAGRNQIKHIIFEQDNIPSVGGYAFYGMSAVEDIKLPTGLITIGEGTFEGCENLKSIEVPDTMTGGIGKNAFKDCKSLTKVVIPSSVNSMGQNSFSGCNNITELTLPFVGSQNGEENNTNTFAYIFGTVPSSLKKITITNETKLPDGAFEGCESVKSIDILSTITSIGTSAFKDCTSLQKFIINDGITEINDYTFQNCSSIENITIPDTISSIGISAFDGCKKLKSVYIPDGITELKDCTFRNCASITEINIHDNITSIGENVLAGCESLSSIKIPFVGASNKSDVTAITHEGVFGYLFGKADGGTKQGDNYYAIPSSVTKVEVTNADRSSAITPGAFMNCSNIYDIIINGGRTVCSEAFKGCTSLKSLYLPKTVSAIQNNILEGCSNLEVLTVPFIGKNKGDAGTETSVLGAFFGWSDELTTRTDVYQYYNASEGHYYHVPETLTKVVVLGQTDIPYGAFMECYNLEQVSIITGAVMNDRAFYNCTYLKQVSLPSDLQEIGTEAFAECESLEYVNIPSGASKIGNYAFYNARNLKEITIPKSVENIADQVFAGIGLLNVGDIELFADDKLTIVCAEGSKAEEYAIANNIPYRLESEEQVEIKTTETVINQLESDSSYMFTVTDTNTLSGTIILAFYDETGDMTYMHTVVADKSGAYNIPIEEEIVNNASTAKVFIWDSISGMTPQTTAEVRDI